MPFIFKKLAIPEVILIEPQTFADERGSFMEYYKESDLHGHGITDQFTQDNQSESAYGVLRGLHYQLPPNAQAKLVRVVVGTVLDVAVDIRKSSPTFGRWVSAELCGENLRMMYIPQGFAHGFVTLSDRAIFSYKCSAEYAKESEAGIRWDDVDLAIDWRDIDVLVSGKDATLPPFRSAEVFD